MIHSLVDLLVRESATTRECDTQKSPVCPRRDCQYVTASADGEFL
jgi:hypothetical protein